MLNQLVLIQYKLLLRKRHCIETIIDRLKNISQVVHSRLRNPANFFDSPMANSDCLHLAVPKDPLFISLTRSRLSNLLCSNSDSTLHDTYSHSITIIMTNTLEPLASRLVPLRPLVDRMAAIHFDKLHPFSACLKASFVRAFELVELAAQEDSDSAFFLIPALRAIAEDIILFRFLSSVPVESCEMVIRHLIDLEVQNALTDQHSFFQLFRPFQPILPLPPAQADNKNWKGELTLFWRSNGWPCFTPSRRRSKPPTREIAEKTDPGMLEVVYDFIYRLTSGVVHSNPRVFAKSRLGKVSANAGSPSKRYSEHQEQGGSPFDRGTGLW